ncbi:MAG: TIGR03663 family protein [Lentisphaerae bacterium]|nr:TIGR03663 family protein [Lentisphaerota bacterium]
MARGMKPGLPFWAVLLAVAAAGAWLRAERLGARPMHTDEAVQAVKFGDLLEQGSYVYNPREYHGPTLYYLTVPWARALGARSLGDMTETRLRAVPLAFGVGLVLLSALLVPALGRGGAALAAAAVALNPFLVYYGRYYIQETLLVFFTAAAVACGWRHLRRPSAAWAAAAGLAAGLMFATKETSAIAYAAAAAGLVAAGAFARGADGRRAWTAVRPAHAAVFAAAAAVVVVLFFSSFFTNMRGLWDSIAAYGFFARRAEGAGHAKPWSHYLQILFLHRAGPLGIWSQWAPLLLGAAGAWFAFRGGRGAPPSRGLARFLAVFAAASFAAYSIIPYKTPWLILTPLWALSVLAGAGARGLWLAFPGAAARAGLVLLLAAGAADLLRQGRWINGRYAADPRNPCAYEHTSSDLLNGVRTILDAAAVAPEGRSMLVRVVSPEYWPLPWYLRSLPNVGYWTEVPQPADAPVVVASPNLMPALEAALKDRYVPSVAGLRPGVALQVLVREDLWTKLLERRAGTPP